jgi:4-hydroxy-3-methylbut-2-en-1-yl diphosphate reductase
VGAKPELLVLLANPRGFCAGVVRAIDALDEALTRYGAPIYVRHEIVHNPHVVNGFRNRGAIFVDELHEIPDGARVMLSAHGVAPAVRAEAVRRCLRVVDTTCPLVTKVHREAEHNAAKGRIVIVVGHHGHPEVIGTTGCLEGKPHHVVSSLAEVEAIPFEASATYAYVTQTTLSRDETSEIVAALEQRFPVIVGPAREDICYATTNRQQAVKAIAPHCDVMIVVGGRHSSNSQRLLETALKAGCSRAHLIEDPAEIVEQSLDGCSTAGLTSGASTPEELVEAVMRHLSDRFALQTQSLGAAETVAFRPASVAALA